MSAGCDGVRLRRTHSVTRAEEIQASEEKVRKSQPDKPVHKHRDSLLSWASGFQDFTGFVNWAFLLLSIGGLRLLLENFIKYGIRIDPLDWIYFFTGQDENTTNHPSILLVSYAAVPTIFCLFTEKALAKEVIERRVGMFIHITNLVILILFPMFVIHYGEGFSLMGASMVTLTYSVLFLKLWSYIQVNSWCRSSREPASRKNSLRRQTLSYSSLSENGKGSSKDDNGETLVRYPDNLNVKDMVYFLFAPTLCYELNFPRTDRIRKRFLLKRIFEVLAGTQLILSVLQQYMVPCVKNSLIPFSNMDITLALERLLKLAIPNHLIWLCFFYISFHSWMNLLGELLHFGDRTFYGDWWNANNIDIFWRLWNTPVHRWCVRHLYLPLVEMGHSRNMAAITVFFFSAFFHEYMVSVPLKTYKIWAFSGMMGQIPLSYLSRYTERRYGARWGNLIVWASLIIGQPMCILMYYHDYVVTHYGQALLEQYGHV